MFRCTHRRKREAKSFRVTIHDSAREFRLAMEGDLGAPQAREVESVWTTAASTIPGRAFVIDLAGITSVDPLAAPLLARMRERGGTITGIGGAPRRPAPSPAARFLKQLPLLAECLLLRLRTRTWAAGTPR